MMWENQLAKRKIDTNYIITPEKFLLNIYAVDVANLDKNYERIKKLNHREINYILNDLGFKPLSKDITNENVLKGIIILVKYKKGIIKAYYSPRYLLEHRNKTEKVKKIKRLDK